MVTSSMVGKFNSIGAWGIFLILLATTSASQTQPKSFLEVRRILGSFLVSDPIGTSVKTSRIETIEYAKENFDLIFLPDDKRTVSEFAILSVLDIDSDVVYSQLPRSFQDVQILFTLRSTENITNNTVICPSDVKKCLGGTYVSREGLDCGFKQCPRLIPLIIILFSALALLSIVLIPFIMQYRYLAKRSQGLIGLNFAPERTSVKLSEDYDSGGSNNSSSSREDDDEVVKRSHIVK
eukprot:TRINITY_DN2850_c0_g1_i1.p1 TRINITY_DN2850_c0_g1~~TRINITY_DN2850_c0_g1_i1.p1  ORF type:complete len:237 (+),score=6.45 TRINITY_DN2850_c0_g1_i1:73-783(+)